MISFPGHVIRAGEADAAVVSEIQAGLKDKGYGPFHAGQFDDQMTSVVKAFQSVNSDTDGHTLTADGEVGLYTWGALFFPPAVSPQSAASPLMLQTVAVASGQVGQMEIPRGSNRGPMVDEYLRSAGIDPTRGSAEERPWCMAFVYWCFEQASATLGAQTPVPRTARCMEHWNLAKNRPGVVEISAASAYASPGLVKPGFVFVLDFGSGLGHTGIVERLLPGAHLQTIEGNSNSDGSREGVGVFRLTRRKLSDATLKGFIDYTGA